MGVETATAEGWSARTMTGRPLSGRVHAIDACADVAVVVGGACGHAGGLFVTAIISARGGDGGADGVDACGRDEKVVGA